MVLLLLLHPLNGQSGCLHVYESVRFWLVFESANTRNVSLCATCPLFSRQSPYSLQQSVSLRFEEFGIEGLDGRWGGDDVPGRDRGLKTSF